MTSLATFRRIRFGFLAGGLALSLACTSGSAVAADKDDGDPSDRAPAEALSNDGWRFLGLSGRKPAEFSAAADGSIRVSADGGVAFLYRMVADEKNDMARLAWRWRVDKAVPATDLGRPGDDRSLAVHLVFPVDGDRLSLAEKFDLAKARAFAAPMAGRVLTYVWGGDHPAGTMMGNPHLEPWGHQIVLRPAAAPRRTWMMEDVDFIADFEKVFGYHPPPPRYVVISADSDDTGSKTMGSVADLMFHANPPAGQYQP